MIPAIEIVDYRYFEWTIGAPQVAADNAIHGAWVSGDTVHRVAAPRPVCGESDRAHCNGELVDVLVPERRCSGTRWLCWRGWRTSCRQFGLRLRAGDVVTTGVTTGVFEVGAGDRVDAEFEGVGSVSVAFI